MYSPRDSCRSRSRFSPTGIVGAYSNTNSSTPEQICGDSTAIRRSSNRRRKPIVSTRMDHFILRSSVDVILERGRINAATVAAHKRQESHLSEFSITLYETQDSDIPRIADDILAEVAEDQRLGTGCHGRTVLIDGVWITQQSIRLISSQTRQRRHPQRTRRTVHQFLQRLDGRIRGHPTSTRTVERVKCMLSVQQIVVSDGCSLANCASLAQPSLSPDSKRSRSAGRGASGEVRVGDAAEAGRQQVSHQSVNVEEGILQQLDGDKYELRAVFERLQDYLTECDVLRIMGVVFTNDLTHVRGIVNRWPRNVTAIRRREHAGNLPHAAVCLQRNIQFLAEPLRNQITTNSRARALNTNFSWQRIPLNRGTPMCHDLAVFRRQTLETVSHPVSKRLPLFHLALFRGQRRLRFVGPNFLWQWIHRPSQFGLTLFHRLAANNVLALSGVVSIHLVPLRFLFLGHAALFFVCLFDKQ